MGEIEKILIVYGPLGLLALIGLVSTVHLYRDRNKTQDLHVAELKRICKEHDDQVERLMKEHADKTHLLEERYISKSETWMAKWQEISRSQVALLEGIQRKRRPGGGGD